MVLTMATERMKEIPFVFSTFLLSLSTSIPFEILK
jgi:hypothetical protein